MTSIALPPAFISALADFIEAALPFYNASSVAVAANPEPGVGSVARSDRQPHGTVPRNGLGSLSHGCLPPSPDAEATTLGAETDHRQDAAGEPQIPLPEGLRWLETTTGRSQASQVLTPIGLGPVTTRRVRRGSHLGGPDAAQPDETSQSDAARATTSVAETLPLGNCRTDSPSQPCPASTLSRAGRGAIIDTSEVA